MATLLDLALKASLLMIVAGALIVLMRRASAASRHVGLSAALGALLLLPVARWTLPALPVFVLTAESEPAPAPRTPTGAFAPVAPPVGAAEPLIIGPAHRSVPSGPATEFVRASHPSWSWPSVLGILWLLGTAALVVRMTVAGFRIRGLTRDAEPIGDARMNARLLEIKTQFGIARPVSLVAATHEWMPLTWGLLRPTILLPSSAATWIETHPMRLDAVLLHEMAHVARWDAAWQRIARIAVALFWFNPLVWIVARRARLEQERACDDAVLARGLRATNYASDLVVLAQTLVLPSRGAGNALAMARQSQLEQRIGALLDSRLSHRRASRVSRLLAIALVVLMLPMSAAQLAARPRAAPESPVISDQAASRESVVPSIARLKSRPVASQAIPRPTFGAVHVVNAPASGREAPPSPASPLNIEAQPTVEPPQQSTPLISQVAKWKVERDAMFRLLTERARTYVKNTRIRIKIGTASPLDTKWLEDTLALVERSAVAPVGSTTSFVAVNLPTDAQIATVKAKFAEAIHNLDAAEVRWDNGLLTNQELSAAVAAALRALTEDPVQNLNARALYALLNGRVSSVSAPLSDADLIDMLKGAASITDDVQRANTLLDLAARYAFTPEMVTLYVAAAKNITSATEQARVFAQPIRVK